MIASSLLYNQNQELSKYHNFDKILCYLGAVLNHYANFSIECIDAMQAMLSREEFIGYVRGNIFKYQWRYKLKNGVEDLKKAQWYQNKLIEVEENE